MWPSDLSAKRPQTWHKKAQHVFELFWTSGKTRLQVRRRLQTNVPNPQSFLVFKPKSCNQSHTEVALVASDIEVLQAIASDAGPQQTSSAKHPVQWRLSTELHMCEKVLIDRSRPISAHLYKYSKWKETEPLAFPPLMDAITASRTTKPVLRSGLESVRIPYHPHWRHWHCPGCNSKEYSTNLRLVVSEVRDGKEHPSRFFVQGPSSKNKLQRLETLPKTANEQSSQGQFVGDPHSRVLL